MAGGGAQALLQGWPNSVWGVVSPPSNMVALLTLSWRGVPVVSPAPRCAQALRKLREGHSWGTGLSPRQGSLTGLETTVKPGLSPALPLAGHTTLDTSQNPPGRTVVRIQRQRHTEATIIIICGLQALFQI